LAKSKNPKLIPNPKIFRLENSKGGEPKPQLRRTVKL